jgi:hypothetical protein
MAPIGRGAYNVCGSRNPANDTRDMAESLFWFTSPPPTSKSIVRPRDGQIARRTSMEFVIWIETRIADHTFDKRGARQSCQFREEKLPIGSLLRRFTTGILS